MKLKITASCVVDTEPEDQEQDLERLQDNNGEGAFELLQFASERGTNEFKVTVEPYA